MITRKGFLAGAGAMAATGMKAFGAEAVKPQEIRAMLLHLGHNWACEWFPDDFDIEPLKAKYKNGMFPDRKLRTPDNLWHEATDYLASKKCFNMIVVDVLEGLVYPSHPELAVEGSWTPEKMQKEIKRMNDLGFEVIPKLNFSTTHNGWLKQYRRMLSTPKYYEVCDDVIRDVCEVFGHPRFFHIGCDEETARHQDNSGRMLYLSIRKDEFWKHDFLKLVATVEKLGMRAWAWNDYGWDHADFYDWCPKSVLMNSWYYDECWGGFELEKNKTADHRRLKSFYDLDKRGFDQVPCGTNWVGWVRKREKAGADDVIGKLISTMRRDISKEHLKGFMMAPWCCADNAEHMDFIRKAADLYAAAI